MKRPLWREDGSVIRLYKWYWALQTMSLSGPSPTEFQIIFCCLIFYWGPFLSPITARRATVQVFYPASSRRGPMLLGVWFQFPDSYTQNFDSNIWQNNCRYKATARTEEKTPINVCSHVAAGTCPQSCSLATAVVLWLFTRLGLPVEVWMNAKASLVTRVGHVSVLGEFGSCNISVGIQTGYGLDNGRSEVRFPVVARIFTFPYHPYRFWGLFNPLYNGYLGHFHEVKTGGEWISPLTFN
jgi:hypothetical protein